MSFRLNAAGVGTLFVVSLLFSADSRADYIIDGGFTGTNRVRDDGTVVGQYFPPPAARALVETADGGHVVTPDLSTVYQFTNSLGHSTHIFAYDVASRVYQPDKLLHSGFHFPGGDENFIIHPYMSLIRTNDPLGKGDLFTISGNTGFLDSKPQIKRYNRGTDSYVETIDPPTDQSILDFGFGPDNRLYMAGQNGIFVYTESATGFDLVSPTPLLGTLTGKLTFGADGRLYLLNSANGNVERYTVGGAFVDTFVPAVGGYINGSIQFGVDGNLHVLTSPIQIRRFAGATGSPLGTTTFEEVSPSFQYGASGRIFYLSIPEPNSLLLAVVGAALVLLRRRRT